MPNSYYGGYDRNSSSGGETAIAVFIVIAIIVFFVSIIVGSGSNSSSSSDYDNYSSYDDYSVPSYVDDYPTPDYDDYDYGYEEPDIETWDCIDVTSYDKNPYNDNYCVSSYGQEMYTTDSYAESLDPYYTAGESGHTYYNSF